MGTQPEPLVAANGGNVHLENKDTQHEDTPSARDVLGHSSDRRPRYSTALLSTREAATRMGIAPSTLRYWRMLHIGPKFVRLTCRNFRYHERDVDAYVEARTYDPSARASLEENANR